MIVSIQFYRPEVDAKLYGTLNNLTWTDIS